MITVKGATDIETDVLVIEKSVPFDTIDYNTDADNIMAMFRSTLPEYTYRILVEKMAADYREMFDKSP